MKFIAFLLLMISAPSWASYCRCEVFAVAPLTVSKDAGSYALGDYKASYYGAYDLKSQKACLRECQVTAMKDYDATYLKEQLTPWTDQLMAGGMAGYNCTGPTDFKIPVRVRAKIGDMSLGLAHQTMVFLHRNKSCF